MSTFIDGVGQCQVLDKSAEIVDLKGHDITSLARTGVFNWEHQSGTPATLVGKILKAKKIFSKDDCDDDRELYYWDKCKAPYLYIMGELLDEYTASAKECAGQMRYSRDNPNQAPLLGFSIEGSEIPNTRQGQLITRSIARKCTLTAAPCNSMCIAEIFEGNQKPQIKDDFEEIFKSEANAIELFKSGEGVKIYETYLAKKEAEGPSQGGKPPKSPSVEYQGQGIEHGKTKGGEAAYSHGHIAPYKFNPAEHQEGGEFHEHANVMAKNPKLQENKQGRMKMNATATAAGGRRENRAALSLNDKNNIANQQGKQLMAKNEKGCQHRKPNLTKSEPKGWSPAKVDKKAGAVHWNHPNHGYVSIVKQPTGEFHVKHRGGLAGIKGVKGVFSTSKEAGKHARSYMSGLSNGTVAPPPSHVELKKAIEAGSYNAAPSTLTNGAAYQTESLGSRQASTGAENHNFQATKKKDWNKKANEEYDKWPHKEKFESFMKARLPHLHDGEIRAIGKLVSLKKSLEKGEDQNPKLGSHFLFSAENPMHPHKNELKMDHGQTLAHLKNKGFNAHEVKGHYGAPETSIMVNNVNPKQAEHLHGIASKLGQDSSIYSKGGKHEMRFHHGENAGKKVHGEGTVWHKEKPADFYTTLPNGKHFTHNFDFGKSLNKSDLIPPPNKNTYKELILHHGTKSKTPFEHFDMKHHASGFYPGVYTSSDPKETEKHGSPIKVGFKGHIFDIKDHKHAEQLHKLAGGCGSGHPLVQKLKAAGYHGIKRGNEHIIFDPEHAKIQKSEDVAKELDEKSLKDIQKETAEKWADRAVEAYKKAIAEKSIKWLMDAIEYGHEAIEHSSLGEDLAVFEKIRAKIMPIHKEALELLAPGVAA